MNRVTFKVQRRWCELYVAVPVAKGYKAVTAQAGAVNRDQLLALNLADVGAICLPPSCKARALAAAETPDTVGDQLGARHRRPE